MVASRQVEITFYRGIGRRRGRGFGALAQVVGRTAIPFLREHIVPAAERVDADLLEFAAPESAEVVSGRKEFKTAAKSELRQTLRKQLGVVAEKGQQAESFQKNLQKNQPVARRHFYKQSSLIISGSFRYQPFLAVSGHFLRKVPVVDNVSSSHEQETYPTTSLDENCRVCFSNGLELSGWFETSLLGFEFKFVKGRGYDTYNTKKRSPKRGKGGWGNGCDRGGRWSSSSSRYSSKQHSTLNFFQCWSVYQQSSKLLVYQSVYAQILHSQQLEEAIFEHKGGFHWEGYDYENFPYELMETPFSKPFFHKENENAY